MTLSMDILKLSQKDSDMNVVERCDVYKSVNYKPIICEKLIMPFNIASRCSKRRAEVTLAPLVTNSDVKHPSTCTVQPTKRCAA
jgi:hypothetical protein